MHTTTHKAKLDVKELLPASAVQKRSLLDRAATLPSINLTDYQVCDLEQILIGGFSPLSGFMTEEEYKSVVNAMRLPSGEIFPMPITLDIADAHFALGDEVMLADKYGLPLAILKVESIFRPDRAHEAQMVFGTLDEKHPGVYRLTREVEPVIIGGPVVGIQLPTRHDFAELRKTPRELRAHFSANGVEKVIGFQTRNPVHRAHFELMKRAAENVGGHILLHPTVGLTKEGDIDYITRVRAYKKLHEARMKEFATLSLLQLAMRMGGPREALWHAIIRRNYGCTHFIVGRDHAGPGNDSEGKPFYAPYAAQELVKKFEKDIGISIITSQEMVYAVAEKRYKPMNEVREGEEIGKISGTQFRGMLGGEGAVPEWFSFPEVIEELKRGHRQALKSRGIAIFFTGLSGAGKSTIATILYTKLLEVQDRKVTLLDGDVVRLHLSKGLGFSKEDRNTNIRRIGFVANEVVKHGGIAICSAVAPYRESRDENRELIRKNGTYIEVHVATPLAVCRERDVKGLYKKAEAGLLKGLTGVDDPYEAPEAAELTIDTSGLSPIEAADLILSYLSEHNLA